MEDEHFNINELLQRYRTGQCSPEEQKWLELHSLKFIEGLPDEQTEDLEYGVWQEVYAHIEAGKRVRRIRKRRERLIQIASAAILLIVASIVFLSQRQQSGMSQQATVHAIGDIAPGGNRAYLTLADGRQIALDSITNGTLAQQAGVQISKTADGEVIYSPNTSSLKPNTENPIFNTITTPKGGQYQVTLPDGSKVWLNAASSLTFPVSFDGMATRSVTFTGEAYFEVVHQTNEKPFLVSNHMQQIQVLGTRFNVSAYPEETTTRTALLEGSVEVTAAGKKKVIKPGFETLVTKTQLDVAPADLETAIAWKNGNIKFKDQDLPTIMRTISRWYDLDVKYEGPATPKRFTGFISRKSSLSSLLKILKLSKIDFELHEEQGKKTLTVKQ